MARCQVTFEEVDPGRSAHPVEVELGPPPPPAWRGRAGVQERRSHPSRTALVLAVLAVAAWALWPSATRVDGGPAEEAAAQVRTPRPGAGVVAVAAGDVVDPPWRGVFEHHPDSRGMVSVPRVHVLSLAGPGATRALLVVDATRRAFGDPERGWRDGEVPRRVLGAPDGAGVRTLQWDDRGYGVSLTTSGLSLADQERLAAALVLPEGPALVHGRAPALDDAALAGAGFVLTDLRSGPGTPVGSHLIGQTGGAAVDGLVHRGDGGTVLVSVVEDQVASAARVRRALAPRADLPVGSVPGATSAALVAHDGEAADDRRIRGWTRLLLDLAGGVTVELSSDVLGGTELVGVAHALDLAGLARTVAPRR